MLARHVLVSMAAWPLRGNLAFGLPTPVLSTRMALFRIGHLDLCGLRQIQECVATGATNQDGQTQAINVLGCQNLIATAA